MQCPKCHSNLMHIRNTAVCEHCGTIYTVRMEEHNVGCAVMLVIALALSVTFAVGVVVGLAL